MKKKGKNIGINRRDFMKKAGAAAAVAGAVSTAPRLVKPAFAADKEYILIGRPAPLTGPVAVFGEPAPWAADRAVAEINAKGGIYLEDYGKKLPVKAKLLDTGSDAAKAAELASRLILNDKVDVMFVSSTPVTVSPTAANCERHKVPCICSLCPTEMWLPGGPFHWSFDASPSVADFSIAFMKMWPDVDTNKVVCLCAMNDVDGVAWADASHGPLNAAGYTVVDLGRFPVGTKDYSSQIIKWKKENCEILFANMAPPDFATLWRQCFQLKFIPKICTVGRATSYPSAVEALGGDLGLGTSSEAPWHPSFPFKSSLTGCTGREFADAWEKYANKMWTAVLAGNYLGYEVIYNVLNRVKTLDKEAVRKGMADTDMVTIQGPVKVNTEDNTAIVPVGALQWIKGTKWPYACKLVSNGNWDMIPTDGKLVSIRKLRGM